MAAPLNFEQLERDLENEADNLDVIQYWVRQLSEVMQSEHTAAEELKEVAEREAVEMAEKEEIWEQERELLKEEISGLRERITSQAGADATNEAFRAEIDSLNAENAHLKQLGRERDRELADQRDKVEELTGKVGLFERERNSWTNTQLQLEDTIRELNRRLSAKTEGVPRGEWESRKLRQRSEQALQLGEQLRNADAQNVDLKQRVDALTKALEEATSLLQETTRKYEKLREQFAHTTTNAERLMAANRDLRHTLDMKETILTDKQDTADVSSRQTEDLLRSKEAQIQRLREVNQRQEAELEEVHARLQLEHNEEREEELERLRVELLEATKVARHLFGESLESADGQAADATSDLRVRIVHLNREVETLKEQLKEAEDEKTQVNRTAEEKDVQLNRVHGDLERMRELAFGDAADHVRDLEKQLEFRDRQISQLSMKCSLMQLELEGIVPPKKSAEDSTHEKERAEEQQPTKRRRSSEKPKKRRRPPLPPADRKQETKEESGERTPEELPEQRETIDRAPPPIVDPPKTLTALELIRLLDEEGLQHTTHDRDFLLRSLFVEFKRLTEHLNERNSQISALREATKQNEKRVAEERAKLRESEQKYAQFRAEILGSAEVVDEATLERRVEELMIENGELNRLASSIRVGGSEMERRFEEATRRLVHLAIQLHNQERRTANLGRRHRALSDECAQLRGRVGRLQTADERRAQQLARENASALANPPAHSRLQEMNMIEIARLQNALVHSVPARSYDRLLADFKRLLHRQTMHTVGGQAAASDVDPGYESGIEEQRQFDITMNEVVADGRGIAALAAENQELRTSVDILERQQEHWKRQHALQEAENRELRAFLDDLENQTDLKSMIANIERRFLQALREQTDATDEQLASEAELRRLRRDLQSTKQKWRQDRHRLVEVVGSLQLQMQRLRSTKAGSLSVAQLMALQTAADEMRTKERRLNEQLDEAERKLAELDRQQAIAEALRETAAEVLKGNFELQNVQLTLQRVHFHAKTLANELRACQSKSRRLEAELERSVAENAELRREVDEIEATAISTTLIKLPDSPAHKEGGDRKKEEEETNRESPKESAPPVPLRIADFELPSEESDASASTSDRTPRSPAAFAPMPPARTVVVDNTEGYERQIEELKEAARSTIQSYKEQLERKERALDDCRKLVEKMTLAASAAADLPPVRRPSLPSDRLRTGAEGLSNEEEGERERQLISLRWSVAELEEANARLADQLREAHASSAVAAIVGRNVAVQTNPAEQPAVVEPSRTRDHSPESNGDSADGSTQSNDSGTVDDLSDDEERRTAPKRARSRSNSTRTIEGASQAESQLYRERNEVRRLRARLSALERKNRDLVNECDALRQRTKHVRNLDPDAEVNLLRRDNERLRREAKKTAEKAQEQTERADQLDQKLKRYNENIRERADGWAKRKKLEDELRALRQRLAAADEQTAELNDKLERRDRLIEKIGRGHSDQAGTVEKIRAELNAARQREAAATRAEAGLKHENLVLQERLRECGVRADSAMKQNHALRARLQRSTSSVEIQTPAEWLRADGATAVWDVRGSARPPKNLQAARPVDSPPRLRTPTISRWTNTEVEEPKDQTAALSHQLRVSELKCAEFREQLDDLQEEYDRLDEEYTRFKRIRNSPRAQASASVVILEDKLKGKQREINNQQKRIEELEDTIQRWRLSA